VAANANLLFLLAWRIAYLRTTSGLAVAGERMLFDEIGINRASNYTADNA